MKTIIYFFSFFLTAFLCFSFTLSANEMTSTTAIINGRKIVRANWPTEYMGVDSDIVPLNSGGKTVDPNLTISSQTPCIQVNQNNQIQIELSYSIQNIADLANAPDIYLRYIVGNTTGILTEDDMQIGGSTLFSEIITIQFDNPLPDQFEYTFELLTTDSNGGYIPYPIDAYPDLFVEDENAPYTLFEPQTILMGVKLLCQELGFVPSFPLLADNSSLPEQHDLFVSDKISNTSTPQFTELKAYPNPFTHQLLINGNIIENSTIQLFDLQGRIVFLEKNLTFEQDVPYRIDTSQLLSGIYYCKIQNSTSIQTIKVVKQ